MNAELSQKEKLLLMMTDIYNQLEELESVLEDSFSNLRETYYAKEIVRISELDKKMVNFEWEMEQIHVEDYPEWDINQTKKSPSLKFELGF